MYTESNEFRHSASLIWGRTEHSHYEVWPHHFRYRHMIQFIEDELDHDPHAKQFIASLVLVHIRNHMR